MAADAPQIKIEYLTFHSAVGQRDAARRLNQLRAEAIFLADESGPGRARDALDFLAHACTEVIRHTVERSDPGPAPSVGRA